MGADVRKNSPRRLVHRPVFLLDGVPSFRSCTRSQGAERSVCSISIHPRAGEDAVLAGVHDALDVAEQGDTNGSQHSAAEQLASRFIGLKQLLNTSVNGERPEAEASTAADEVEAGLTEAPRSPVGPSSFDDELEKRLAAPPPAAGPDNAAQDDASDP